MSDAEALAECANYTKGGCIFLPECLILAGKRCRYFENRVAPAVQAKADRELARRDARLGRRTRHKGPRRPSKAQG